MTLPFDLRMPPGEPPSRAHPLWWRMAWRLWTDHRADRQGRCRVCPPTADWPCEARRLAAAGLVEVCVGRKPWWAHTGGYPGRGRWWGVPRGWVG